MVRKACAEIRCGSVNCEWLWNSGSLVKEVVLREVRVKVVVVAPAYLFAFYPSAFPFLEGQYFGKIFQWEIDAESARCCWIGHVRVRLELRRRSENDCGRGGLYASGLGGVTYLRDPADAFA